MSRGDDMMMEAGVAVMTFEVGRRGHQPRSADS